MNLPFFRLCVWADFVKAKCLMNAEVALVLQRKYEQLQQLSDDPVSQISQYVTSLNTN
jgi:DNA-directed RNA polymerase II subunit RPB4